MRGKSLAKIGVLLLLFLFTAPSTAEITSVKLRSDDRHLILLEKFGFTETGHVSVAISSVSITSVPVTSNVSRPNPSRLGFFLISQEAQPDFQQERNSCDLYSKFISLLFTFQDLSPDHSSFNTSHNVTFPSEYSLYFANCNPLSYVTMNIVTEFYNIDNGATKDYLSSGLTRLPSLYFIFSLMYWCFLGFWIAVCFKNMSSFQKIHLAMGMLLVTKAIILLSAWKDQYRIKVTGTTSHAWEDMVYVYVYQLFKAVLLYIAMAMMGDGSCSFLKPILQENSDRKILKIVIPFQVLATVASNSIVIGRSRDQSWVIWNAVLLLVECLCCFAIIYRIRLSTLRENENDDDHVKGARKILGKFYMVVIGYLFVGFFLLWGILIIVDYYYKYEWVCIALVEITSLVFYMVMFCMFRPFEEKEYFVQINLQEPVEEPVDHNVQDKQLEEFELV